MLAKNHLLYIDITTKCGLGCEFCMYSSYSMEGSNLELTDHGFSQLSNLINHPDVKHIIISGEGEPFKATDLLKKVLSLSLGENYFQIITNGSWMNEVSQFNDIVEIANNNNDNLSVRFSLDSFHWSILGKDTYKNIFSLISKYHSNNISFAFRSLLEEKEKTREYIDNISGITPIHHTDLDDIIYYENIEISLTYKNMVYPNKEENKVSLNQYIDMLSIKYSKDFTFENLSTGCSQKGLDITIKPSGEIYFYGIDNKSYCNLNQSSLFHMLHCIFSLIL